METVLLICAACGPGARAVSEPFIAFATDFHAYTRWEKFEIRGAPAEGDGSVHTAGDRIIYLNQRPAHGAPAFPVGTLIVKTLPGAGQVFARAKRGGGYNSTGAAGWEWFELQHLSADDVTIVWRGVGPPSSEAGYGTQADGCNVCHLGAKANDSVSAAPLALSDL